MNQDQVLGVALALLLVLGLLLLLAWVAKRSGWLPARAGRNSNLRLLASLSLGPRNSVVIIEAEGERLVLGVSSNQISLLHSSASAPAASPAEQAPQDSEFAQTLQKTLADS